MPFIPRRFLNCHHTRHVEVSREVTVFVLLCHFTISFLRDIHDRFYLHSPLGIYMTQCLSCSPRHFGTGEFTATTQQANDNKRTITSERYQAAVVCMLTRLGIVERRRSLTQSKHRFTLFTSFQHGLWLLESSLSTISPPIPPLKHRLPNTPSPTPPPYQ